MGFCVNNLCKMVNILTRRHCKWFYLRCMSNDTHLRDISSFLRSSECMFTIKYLLSLTSAWCLIFFFLMHMSVVLCGRKQAITASPTIVLFAAPQFVAEVFSFLYSAGKASFTCNASRCTKSVMQNFKQIVGRKKFVLSKTPCLMWTATRG